MQTIKPLGRISRFAWARFLEKVDPPDIHGCQLWNASISGEYGQFHLNGRYVRPHRVAWEHENGPIPEGMEIDHVWARGCRSKLCVNTAHLETVTPAENRLRDHAARRWRASIQVRTELDDDPA